VHDVTVPRQQPDLRRILIAVSSALLAFLAYTCVYAYRKPFTVATFEGLQFMGVSYQTLLIISQVFGYMLSKFAGIKFIGELKRTGRMMASVLLTLAAWACLFCFAIVPAPYGMFFLFINGFTLGFLWGIIFSYLEGRRSTDFMGAVMAVSFIFAGGFTRSVAKWIMMQWEITEKWMPFFTGMLFIVPLVLFLYLLEKIPPPDTVDVAERSARVPMDRRERGKLIRRFGIGLIAITLAYLFFTIMRDIRDNYMANIWNELGYGSDLTILTVTETRSSLMVLMVMAALVLIRKNMQALMIVHAVILFGTLLAGLSSLLFRYGMLNGALWMQLVSLGLYLAYIPFNCIFFERLIAAFRIQGNVGFLMYLADSFGYLGSVIVMLSKELLPGALPWSQFYSIGVVGASAVAALATIISSFYFFKKHAWFRKQQLS